MSTRVWFHAGLGRARPTATVSLLVQAFVFGLILAAAPIHSYADDNLPLAGRPWFETRSRHFHIYSCGSTQDVARLAARLEQFREAYAGLAGELAVASPPIVVMAFPDHAAMEPFLPIYDGKPSNLAAFFARGSDENLITLSLGRAQSLETVFHEYAHLLMRHNDPFWPLWLKEGMADIYGTFEVAGEHLVRIGKPQEYYLSLLARGHLMPLRELFSVNTDSPDYNERQRQGIFYAQSWLLTHYLMLGNNPAHRARFGQLTALLRQGQSIEQAFTAAFQTTLPAMQHQLREYLRRGMFESQNLTVKTSMLAGQSLATRRLSPVEILCRLGDELLRIGRPEEADHYFARANKIAPASPLPYEGLGLVAADAERHAEAVRLLQESLNRGSASFLVHYAYAREKFRLTARDGDSYTTLERTEAAEIRSELEKALALMPDFGPGHHLLGVLELVQGQNLSAAQTHLQRAIALEPEHQSYQLTLAQAQLANRDAAGARKTLAQLCRPNVNAKLRTQAQAMLNALNKEQRGQ
jgi:tetratricopeptide (TPR) repeat protein